MSDATAETVAARYWERRYRSAVYGEPYLPPQDEIAYGLAVEGGTAGVNAALVVDRDHAQLMGGIDRRPINTDDARFEPIWQAIKAWDIQRHPEAGYAYATGTDVQIIMDALDSVASS